MAAKSHSMRVSGVLARYDGGSNTDGPGSVGALWFRGLADERTVD